MLINLSCHVFTCYFKYIFEEIMFSFNTITNKQEHLKDSTRDWES